MDNSAPYPGTISSHIPSILNVRLNLDGINSIRRDLLESYIHSKFNKCYTANIHSFLPHILSLEFNNRLCATIGMRDAAKEPLFLEDYLQNPIEQEIGGRINAEIKRNKIIELGNLVSTWQGSSVLLFIILAKLLSSIDREWVVFTATKKVESILDKMGFRPVFLAYADGNAIANQKDDWGSYYVQKPKVMFGRIPDAMSVLKENIVMYSTLSLFLIQIEELAGKFVS